MSESKEQRIEDSYDVAKILRCKFQYFFCMWTSNYV